MRITLLAAAAAVLGITQAAAQQAPAAATRAAERQNCSDMAKSGRYKTVVQITACEIQADIRYEQTVGFPWMDIEYRADREKLDAAAQADAGRISVQQASDEMAGADVRATNEINRRTGLFLDKQKQRQMDEDAGRAMSALANQLLGRQTPDALPPGVPMAPAQACWAGNWMYCK